MRRRIYRRRRKFTRRRPIRSSRRRIFASSVRRVMYRAAETKFNVNSNIATIGTTGILFSWFDTITQGVGPDQRVGNQIQPQRISYQARWNYTYSAGGANSGLFRIAVIYPRRALQEGTLTSVLPTDMQTMFSPLYWVVKYDKVFRIGTSNPAANGSDPSNVFVQFSMPWRGKINYNPAGNVDIEPKLFVLSTVPLSDNSDIVQNLFVRTSFKDV